MPTRRGVGGDRYKLLGPGGPEGGPGWTTLHMFYVFLGFLVCLYLWIVQVNHFRPNPGQYANKSISDIFIRPALAERHEKKFLSGPEPAVGGRVDCKIVWVNVTHKFYASLQFGI